MDFSEIFRLGPQLLPIWPQISKAITTFENVAAMPDVKEAIATLEEVATILKGDIK